MKNLIFMLLLAGSIGGVYAQNAEKKDKFSPDTPLFEELTNVKKKTDKFNLYLNMQGSFDAHFRDGFQEGDFNMHQLRIEAKGNINNWLSYRYRQRLNRSNDANGMIDNLPTSIDYAGIGIQLNDQFSLFAGKQCAAYGGFEFDLNPIDVYQYCDMIDYMSNFMTGLNVGYNITPDQQLNLQILNSRNSSFDNTYGITEDAEGNLPDLKSGKMPLVYTLNWVGNFNNVFKTRWSASVMNEAKDHNMYYYAVGNELNLGKWNAFIDFMYSKEDILFAALKVNPARIDSYCQAVDEPILEEIRKLPSGASMDQLKDRWYQGRDGSDYHYHSSRYRACYAQKKVMLRIF